MSGWEVNRTRKYKHVRFGSLANIRTAKSHVRFTPESGHVRCNEGCPLWANSGHGGVPSDVHEAPLHFLHQPSSLSLSHSFSFSPTRKNCIESRMALRGNHTLGGSQASENIALTCGDGLAVLHCISIAATHNIVGLCNASWGKFFLVLLQALEHIICLHWHAAALFLKFFAAR